MFAVAAYTMEGKLIGGSIGNTSKPVLCTHTLPILMTYTFLSQARNIIVEVGPWLDAFGYD